MFRSVRIQNFRQFKDLELKNLGRINLITGQNNTGKTSLLEALFLLDNPLDPIRTVTLAYHRGVERPGPESPELWEWLFRDADLSREIELSARQSSDGEDEAEHVSQLSIRLADRGYIPAAGTNGNALREAGAGVYVTSDSTSPELLYESSNLTGATESSRLYWTGERLVSEPNRLTAVRPTKRPFFLWDRHTTSGVDADRLSELEAVGREQQLVEALRVIEPRLKRLVVHSQSGRSSVRVDLGTFPLVPLVLTGRGFSNLLTLVSSMLLGDASIFLIDEFGSGLHYSAMPAVWKAIIAAAVKHDVQIFATTHSLECVKAAADASEGQDAELVLHRLTRRDGQIRATLVEDEGIRAAVGFGFELR